MKINKPRRIARLWIEAVIVGVCVAMTAIVLQYTVGKETWQMRLLLLLGAALVLCLIQFLVSSWIRPRNSAEQPADALEREQSDNQSR